MKSIQTLRVLTLAGLGALFVAPSFAQESTYYYGGLSVGQSRSNLDQDHTANSVIGAGPVVTGIDHNNDGTAYKVFGGYRFTRNIAMEAGYFNLGKFGFTSATTPSGTLNGELKVQGINVDLVGTLPLTDRFAAFGRVGTMYSETRGSFSGSGAVTVSDPSPSQRGMNYKIGAGVQYALNSTLTLRGEFEHYRVNDSVGEHTDINVVSVGLLFPFGGPAAMR
jgi:OOP family OmpA-OmpF porin